MTVGVKGELRYRADQGHMRPLAPAPGPGIQERSQAEAIIRSRM